MGFLDFLKKEESPSRAPPLDGPNELSFGQGIAGEDSFDAVPTPPKQFKDEHALDAKPEVSAALMTSPNATNLGTTTNALGADTNDPFAEDDFHSENPPSWKEDYESPSGLEAAADMTPNNPGAIQTAEGEVPNIPMPDFGVPKEAPVAPEHDASVTEAQEIGEAQDDLAVPELPSLPQEAMMGAMDAPEPVMDYSLESATADVRAPAQPSTKPNPFLTPVEDLPETPAEHDEELLPGFSSPKPEKPSPKKSESAFAQEPVAKQATPKKEPEKGLSFTDDIELAAPIKYLPEHKEMPLPEQETYVDSHEFYELLQEIKAIKRAIKDNDTTMKELETGVADTESKVTSLIVSIDDVQEKLIAIDTGLFER